MTRRLLCNCALWSVVGAGGIGAASDAAGAAGAAGASPHPQALIASQQTSSQPLLLHLKSKSNKRGRLILQPESQPLSQAGTSMPQAGPQAGAAAQPQALFSIPQPGSQTFSTPQPGSQAGVLSQQSFLGFKLCNKANKGFLRGLTQATSVPQLGAAQPLLQASTPQPGSQALHAFSMPQPGSQAFSIPQPGSQALSMPQPGSQALQAFSIPQPGSQAFSTPQPGSHAGVVSQQLVSQPAPFKLSKRSKRPPPKLGVQRLAPSTNEPTKMFHFI